MKTMMLILEMVLGFYVISHPLVIASNVREDDGTYWEKLSEHSDLKVFFISGFIAGNCTVYFSLDKTDMLTSLTIDYIPKEAKNPITLLQEIIQEDLQIVDLSGITTGQLVNGVDEFYKDFSNQRIKIIDVVYVVKMQIKGESPDLIDAQIRYLKMQPTDRGKSDLRYIGEGVKSRKTTYKDVKDGKVSKEDLLKGGWFIGEDDKQHSLFCYGKYK